MEPWLRSLARARLCPGTRAVSPCSQPRALSYSPIHGLWLPVATRKRKPTCNCFIIIFRKNCALESSWRWVSKPTEQTWAEHPPGGSPGRPGWGFAGALGTAPLSRGREQHRALAAILPSKGQSCTKQTVCPGCAAAPGLSAGRYILSWVIRGSPYLS